MEVALITGGSRGIGRAIVESLSKEGLKVVFTYKKSEVQARQLAEKTHAIPVRLDNREVNEIEKVIDEVYRQYGVINLLVNNAGVYYRNRFFDSTEEIWNDTIDTNLRGTYFMTKYVAERMLRKGDMVINIASDAGVKTRGIEYGITKNAIIYLSKALLGALEVKVNCICPSHTDTDMASGSEFREYKTSVKANKPEDVADAVVYLVKSASTGKMVLVKNGRIDEIREL